MAFTHDPSTDRGKIRLFVYDIVEASAAFTDAEIDAFLEMNSDSIWYAAADAARSLAAKNTNSAFMLRIEGALKIDKKKIAEYFLSLASKYEGRASSSTENIVEYVDSMAIDVDVTGVDHSEYVGDL